MSRRASPMKVEGQNGEHHCQCGEEDQVRRVEQMRAPIVEHGSPGCRRRGDTQSKELIVASARIAPAMPIAALRSQVERCR
jgi:hypothetical protein